MAVLPLRISEDGKPWQWVSKERESTLGSTVLFSTTQTGDAISCEVVLRRLLLLCLGARLSTSKDAREPRVLYFRVSWEIPDSDTYIADYEHNSKAAYSCGAVVYEIQLTNTSCMQETLLAERKGNRSVRHQPIQLVNKSGRTRRASSSEKYGSRVWVPSRCPSCS